MAPATSEPIPTDDHYSPASTSVTASSASIAFGIPGFSWTCTNSQLNGTTPATGLGKFKVSPTYNDGTGTPCADNLGFKHIMAPSGTWKIGMTDAGSDEAATEPNTGDKLKLTIPLGGLTDSDSLGCLLTFAPSAPITLKSSYSDNGTFRLSTGLTTIPITATNLLGLICQLPSLLGATFSATYTFNQTISDAG
jgi:hypothetical protein